MIKAASFIQSAADYGFNFYAGVPCSFLKPLINYVIDDGASEWISAANEGDAVAIASGAALAGRRAVAIMQNSGLGNAVSPLTSLNRVFNLPILLIVTWRGAPGLSDEPQHELMGKITPKMLDTMDIPWRLFPQEEADVAAILEEACKVMDSSGRPFALIMEKGSVAPWKLKSDSIPERCSESLSYRESPLKATPTRQQVLAEIQAASAGLNSVIIASTGFSGRELFTLEDLPNQLYMVGSMGCASSFALGLAMSRPDLQVIIADGDGAALMRMGNFSTLGSYGGENLHHILLDNGVHESTGGQATVATNVEFAEIAVACGYRSVATGNDLHLINSAISSAGPNFLHVKTSRGVPENLPRPDITPAEVKKRLMNAIGASAPWTDIT